MGAGWACDEVDAVGAEFPDDRGRARRFREALQIVRDLLRHGSCRFEGEHYRIKVDDLSPLSDTPPPLIAAVAGPWTAANIPQLVDRVEIALSGSAHPMLGGIWDGSRLGQLQRDHVARMCDRIRTANPDVMLSCGLLFGVGEPAEVAPLQEALGHGLVASLLGEPEQVASQLATFEDLGIDRITLLPMLPDSHATIASFLNR